MNKKKNNMVTPSVDELSKVDADKSESYNRYTLAIAVAKSARIATDEVRQLNPVDRPATNPIRLGVDRIMGVDEAGNPIDADKKFNINTDSVKADDAKLREEFIKNSKAN